MNSWSWYVARSTGIVATVLIVASLIWGLLFSSRNTGRRLRPNWWLDLHNWLGGLAFAFTVVHVAAVFADSNLAIGVKQIFVPQTATSLRLAMTFGVVAMYVLAVVSLSSVARIRRRLPRPLWHTAHLLSIPMVVLAVLHAYQSGSDALSRMFQIGIVVLLGASAYPLGLRLSGVVAKRLAPVSSRRTA